MWIVVSLLASPMRFACLTMSATMSLGVLCSVLSAVLLIQLVPTWTTIGVTSVAGTAPLVLCIVTLLSWHSLLRPLVLSTKVVESPSTKSSLAPVFPLAPLFSAGTWFPRVKTAGGGGGGGGGGRLSLAGSRTSLLQLAPAWPIMLTQQCCELCHHSFFNDFQLIRQPCL